MKDNEKTLENGFAKAYRMIEDVLYNSFMDAAAHLLVRANSNRQFVGFTGNTQTSYMAGVYIDGRLAGIVQQRENNQPPRRIKIRKGQTVYLTNPYEGRPRAVKGTVETSDDYGSETSLKFLQGYKPPRNAVSIVLTTGTEYSEYLEQVRNLDVLTNTYRNAARIIEQNWKKIDIA